MVLVHLLRIQHFPVINNAEDDDELKVIFSIDEARDLLLLTGFRRPIPLLCLDDKSTIISTLVDYHCILKVSS